MSEYAMPILIINMGGEMLYILEQRLQAQSIVEEKSLRVLLDVINTMFSEKFLLELFKPQRLYSSTSTRQIFDRLAHSSIMRLNQSSMDKLYDLMSMGCKYQVLTVATPADLLATTLNHLDALRKLINNNNHPETYKLLELAHNQLIDLFSHLKFSQLFTLRHTLARFFQDRRVKVSLFLQDQIQQSDGNIVIQTKGKLPRGIEIPGTIRYFNEQNKIIKEEIVKLANAEGLQNANTSDTITAANSSYYVNEILKGPRQCELGTNLYAKDRRKQNKNQSNPNTNAQTSTTATAAIPAKEVAKPVFTPPPAIVQKPSASAQFTELTDESSQRAAKAELNLLAQMIGQAAENNSKEKFQIVNLFPDTQLSNSGEEGKQNNNYGDFITFDVEDLATRNETLKKLADLGLDEDELNRNNNNNNNNNEDDLLALMDSTEQ